MLFRLFLVYAILITAGTSYSHNKIGNGGGGVVNELGEYDLLTTIPNETKYSGVNTVVENCSSPIFTEIKSDIRKMQKFLRKDVGVFLMKNFCRAVFYKQLDPSITNIINPIQKVRIKHFKDIYSLATGIDRERIIIYAVTLPNRRTYFLPEFYKLTFLRQKVILFHEIFWLHFHAHNSMARQLNKREEILMYRKILVLEQALIEYLLNTESIRNQTNFANALYGFHAGATEP